MRRVTQFRFEFVDRFPTPLDGGVLYVSIPFRTAAHLCACGCGTKVVTPLSPAGWVLTFDGDSVSLAPSIGNGRLACRSHYFIRRNHVRWAAPMTDADSQRARQRDAEDRAQYYGTVPAPTPAPVSPPTAARPWWRRVREWIG